MPSRMGRVGADRTFVQFVGLGAFFLIPAVAICQPATQEPLATCELQKISPSPTTGMGDGAVLAGSNPRATGPLDQYQRGFGAQWSVPTQVDPSDANVRLLLLAPADPIVIDIAIEVDGRPFRAVREEWIDMALASGDVPSITSKQNDDPNHDGTLAETPSSETVNDGSFQDSAEVSERGSDPQPESDESTDSKDDETGKVEAETVESRRHEPPQPAARLAGYARMLGGEIDRAEARWLLAEWVPGPALLHLRDGFGWERVGAAPLFVALDQDEDGILSAREIEQAGENLRRLDRNEDDTIDYQELTHRAGSFLKTYRSWKPPRLLVTLSSDTDWHAVSRTLASAYQGRKTARMNGTVSQQPLALLAAKLEAEPNTVLSPEVLPRLLNTEPDAQMVVRFGNHDEAQPEVALVEWNSELGAASEVLHAAANVITVQLPECYLEISAAVPQDENEALASGQISLGAVVDGYPLYREIDADEDNRLSRREVQELEDHLSYLDDDGDGQIGQAEIDIPIRLAVVLGPHVHYVLERSVRAARGPRAGERPTAPDWFTAMDSNRDGDLVRGEFFGTDQQFQQLDTDGDGLISVTESLAAKSTGADATGEQVETIHVEGPEP